MRKYGVKNSGTDGGKYHLVAAIETESDFLEKPYSGKPINDSGLCGRLDPSEKFPRVLGRDSMISSGLCGDCKRLEAKV